MTEGQFHIEPSEEPTGWMAILLKYGIAAIVGVFFLTAALHFTYTPDETYVYLRMAKNFADGDGLAFNMRSPSLEVPSPLWALLLGIGAMTHIDPYIGAKTLDAVLASFSILLLYLLALGIIRDHLFALAAAWIFSFDSWMIRWSATGLESSLAQFLTLLALWYIFKREYSTASFILVPLWFIRPETILLYGVIVVDLYFNSHDRPTFFRILFRSLSVFLVVFVPFAFLAIMYYGRIVPEHYFTVEQISAGKLFNAVKLVFSTQGMTLLVTITGTILALLTKSWDVFREDGFPLFWIFLLFCCSLVLAHDVFLRTSLLITPVICIYALWTIKRLEFSHVVSTTRSLTLLVVLTGLALVQNQFLYRSTVRPYMQRYSEGVNESIRPIAHWLNTNAEYGGKIAAPEIGLLGYVSERRTYRSGQNGYEGTVDYLILYSTESQQVHADSLQLVMTKPAFGLSMFNPEFTYYSLYKVMR
ncbi:MAG: hypothetical protein V1799_04825 [bacterium]